MVLYSSPRVANKSLHRDKSPVSDVCVVVGHELHDARLAVQILEDSVEANLGICAHWIRGLYVLLPSFIVFHVLADIVSGYGKDDGVIGFLQ